MFTYETNFYKYYVKIIWLYIFILKSFLFRNQTHDFVYNINYLIERSTFDQKL